ncbi:MAG: phosphatidylglycerol lysyltransferase domain-containing protein [Candidatus Omnitrophica bacterium]|nr:phosphatidylglycerol lysyltransferase domain-containing protein [Candidatus Omnitrophota bacterium]
MNSLPKAMNRIPDYPQFTALGFEHKAFFDQAFRKFPPRISEFTFTNLFSWREAFNYEVSILEEAVILRSGVGQPARFLQPIGAAESAKIIGRVLGDTKGFFMRIPEETVGFLKKDSRFKVEEDRNNWDYLYLFSDLLNLSGRKYDGKRNQIKKFKSEHDYAYVDINVSEAALILEFEEAWCAVKDCQHVEGLDNERRTLHQIIAHFTDFGVRAGAIKVGGKIRAVAIAEALNTDTLVMHILKADPALSGLYQVMLNDFLAAQDKRFKYVNLEQDLGIAGLRASKQSYHPCGMIKKYTISLKN